MSARPMPTTLYRGPIISLKRGPIISHPKVDVSPYIPARSGTNLQRRPHTKRQPSSPDSGLSPVTEEDEAEDDEPIPFMKPRRRPRPMPLITSRSCPPPNLPFISETPDGSVSFQEEMEQLPKNGLALSPSTLLDRRPSETVLDFPLPPTSSSSLNSSSLPSTPPRQSPSPTFSNKSSSSLSYPPTPQQSDDEGSDKSMFQFYAASPVSKDSEISTEDMTFLDLSDTISISMYSPTLHPFRRTASSMSLRSFGIAQPDTSPELVYTKRQSIVPIGRPDLFKEIEALRADLPEELGEEWVDIPGEGRVLSVVDTANGSFFDVPLVLGSFLPPPSTVEDDDVDSDGEGVPVPSEWTESEHEDSQAGAALSSSEEEDSDVEVIGPSRALDPLGSNSSRRRRKPVRPPRPDTPSIYSMASFSENSLYPSRRQLPHDGHFGVNNSAVSPRQWDFPASPSSSTSDHSPSPQLRSRFSSSTLGSIPEPSSTTSSFFARLMISGRGKHTSSSSHREGPSKGLKASPSRRTSNPNSLSHNRRSMHKASFIPASPTPSAFSFSSYSSSDRERDDMDDASSCFSGVSTGSNGLKRPPIPIELFIRT